MANLSISALATELRRALPDLKLTQDAPLSSLTTLRLGGPADLLAEPASPEDVRVILETVRNTDVPVTVIGRGSNLLVRDGGIRGLVLRIGAEMSALTCDEQTIVALAGASLSSLSAFAADNGLGGLAFACGIPGAVGGGVCMNAGAYGGEMSQVVASVSGFDLYGRPFWYTAGDMGFAYRTSRLQIEEKVVTSVTFALEPGDPEALRAQMAEIGRARAEKQPLNVPSAGSTFRRPKDGYAAALIDECGLKGLRVGGASVSEKHAGFLVNEGDSAADYLALMEQVQETVLQKTGVQLEPEVRILGEDA